MLQWQGQMMPMIDFSGGGVQRFGYDFSHSIRLEVVALADERF